MFIPNASREQFIKNVPIIDNGEHTVEKIDITNECVVIQKPGYKGDADFSVCIAKNGIIQSPLSHAQLLDDVREKTQACTTNGVLIVHALYDVCMGVEPNIALQTHNPKDTIGITVETLLKLYKWIWFQEDLNYPAQGALGRWMSMNQISALLK